MSRSAVTCRAVEIPGGVKQQLAFGLASVAAVDGEVVQDGLGPGATRRSGRRQLKDGAVAVRACSGGAVEVALLVEDEGAHGHVGVWGVGAKRVQGCLRPCTSECCRRTEFENRALAAATCLS